MGAEIFEVQDQNQLVATSEYPYGTFDFDFFNPVQSRIYEFYKEPANILVAAATSSGKTAVAEMSLAHEIRARGGKGMYLGPLKALSQEKIDDWTEDQHHFSDINLSICTGDYRLTADRKQELMDAHVILMTSEMLNSRVRNFQSENNTWLRDLGTLVVDESHLLTVPGRGDHLEAGLMKLTEINPECRLICLSATMPNVRQMAEWLTKLTNRDTYILESTYRPCPLIMHYDAYDDHMWKYDAKEQAKVDAAMDIVLRHAQDKFLIFAHTKRTGELMIKALKKRNVTCEFHNADLRKDKRIQLESRFRNDQKFRVLVATSGLAWGINTPARRVIVLGVHRGLETVATYDVAQMVGRSGRPRYDPRGDAYVLLPRKELKEWMLYLSTPQPIVSQMLDKSGGHKNLAFHIVSEIHRGQVHTTQDIYDWYARSLAAFQDTQLPEETVDKMLTALKNRGVIRENEHGELEVTSVGKIASMFYYSPFDVSDLKRNFKALFDNNKELDDYWLSMALANLETHRCGIVSNLERDIIQEYNARVSTGPLKTALGINSLLMDSTKKIGYCYFSLLNDLSTGPMAGTIRGLQHDFARLAEVLNALDGMLQWDRREYVGNVMRRILYGVDWGLLELCRLPGVGKVKANLLWQANLKTLEKVAEKPNLVKIAIGCSDEKARAISEAAEELKGTKK